MSFYFPFKSIKDFLRRVGNWSEPDHLSFTELMKILGSLAVYIDNMSPKFTDRHPKFQGTIEDLASIIFNHLYERIVQLSKKGLELEPPSKFRAYINTAVRNKITDLHRKFKKKDGEEEVPFDENYPRHLI